MNMEVVSLPRGTYGREFSGNQCVWKEGRRTPLQRGNILPVSSCIRILANREAPTRSQGSGVRQPLLLLETTELETISKFI